MSTLEKGPEDPRCLLEAATGLTDETGTAPVDIIAKTTKSLKKIYAAANRYILIVTGGISAVVAYWERPAIDPGENNDRFDREIESSKSEKRQ